MFLFIYLPLDIRPGVNMLAAALEVPTWPSYTPSRDFALAVMGIALPNNSSLARVVRASFAIHRFRRRLCHCYGAPFGLDTLNKFSVVRSTIKPREKKP